MIALSFLLGLALLALLVPVFLPERLAQISDASYLAPLSRSADGQVLHLCGTDLNGQDLFYRLLSGARVSLGIGLFGALVSLCIGVSYGMVAGFAGGKVDALMMRVVDMINSVPRLLFIMVLIGALGLHFRDALDALRLSLQKQGWTQLESVVRDMMPYSKLMVMVIALGMIEWLTMARIVRGQVLVLREMQFVTAARSMGQSVAVILRKHLLPNLSTVILTYLTLTIPAVILDESFLSFLGLGIEDPASSWGSLLKDGAQVISPIDCKWWLLVFPAVIMSLTLLALNFLGDGLRDAFDPKGN
jgi:peptide/nickel transport system permease protein/oligopeptide transport system permease protein